MLLIYFSQFYVFDRKLNQNHESYRMSHTIACGSSRTFGNPAREKEEESQGKFKYFNRKSKIWEKLLTRNFPKTKFSKSLRENEWFENFTKWKFSKKLRWIIDSKALPKQSFRSFWEKDNGSKTLPNESFHAYGNLSHKQKLPNEGLLNPPYYSSKLQN